VTVDDLDTKREAPLLHGIRSPEAHGRPGAGSAPGGAALRRVLGLPPRAQRVSMRRPEICSGMMRM
jgi:hypothetical protein